MISDRTHDETHGAVAPASLPPRLRALLPAVQDHLAARARNGCATVVFAAGRCSITDALTGIEREAGTGDTLSSDMTLTTGDRGSRLMLRMDDGTELWLGERSHLDLSSWDPAAPARSIALESGRLLAFVAREARRFIARLHHGARVEVLGTSFDVELHEHGVRLDVLTGEVLLRSLKGEAQGRGGTRLVIESSSAPQRRRSAVFSSRRWLTETLRLVNAGDEPFGRGTIARGYAPLLRPSLASRVAESFARHSRALAVTSLLIILTLVARQAYIEGVFAPAPEFSAEELRAALQIVSSEQHRKHGTGPETTRADETPGVLWQGPDGKVTRIPISEYDLHHLEGSALPQDLKASLVTSARDLRDSSATIVNNVLTVGDDRIDISSDAAATSDLLVWMRRMGYSDAEAKRRATLGLTRSIRERLPEDVRTSQDIRIKFIEGGIPQAH